MQEGIDVKVESVIADHIAQLAIERISPEEIEKLIRNTLNDKFNMERKKNWNSDLTETDKRVLNAYYSKLSERINLYMETDEFLGNADETAKRIVENSKKAAEQYLTEAIARRLCVCATDFNGNEYKIDMSSICMNVMNNHLVNEHGKSY